MPETKAKHTPLPWKKHYYHTYGEETQPDIVTIGNDRIATVATWAATKGNKKEADANADFIVRACNSHYELLEALRTAEKALRVLTEEGMNPPSVFFVVQAAIAKASE